MSRKKKRRSKADLRQDFLKRHKEWEAVNNPEGYRTGEVNRLGKRRLEALMKLVRAEDA